MPVKTDIMDWVPGVTKESAGFALDDTSIVFREAIIHPSISDPNVSVSLDEEQMLIFLHSLLYAMHETFESTPEADIPEGFDIRRTVILSEAPDQASIQWTLRVPVELGLLFGKRLP